MCHLAHKQSLLHYRAVCMHDAAAQPLQHQFFRTEDSMWVCRPKRQTIPILHQNDEDSWMDAPMGILRLRVGPTALHSTPCSAACLPAFLCQLSILSVVAGQS